MKFRCQSNQTNGLKFVKKSILQRSGFHEELLSVLWQGVCA